MARVETTERGEDSSDEETAESSESREVEAISPTKSRDCATPNSLPACGTCD